jgi:histidine triad (HIT) family protein
MDCIFCKIVRKEIQSEIVYEDENFIAFLDIYPRSKGMTLVVPKKHIKIFEEDENLSKEMFLIAIKVSEAIKKALSPLAIGIANIPSQIEHLNLRIYPYFENEIPIIENKPIEIKPEELKSIAEIIRNNVKKEKHGKEREEIEEEKSKVEKNEEKRSEEDIFWLKRDWQIA